MPYLNGYHNEYLFTKELNNKLVKELNPMYKEFICSIFNKINNNDTITCWKNKEPQKSDIFIKINNEIKGISIKKGIKNSVHIEMISEFIHFLIENKVHKNIIIEYLKYHYADGSTNGKGTNRISIEEYKKDNQDKIDKINEVLNNESLLRKAIDRFVIKGRNSDIYIDAIICGEINDFIWITKEEIIDIILSKKDIYSTGVHFGPLSVQPQKRCLKYEEKYENYRYKVQLKWYNLFDDIIEVMNNRTKTYN